MNYLILIGLFQIFLVVFDLKLVASHGRLLEPISRASRWRFNSSAPIDYNDNEGFCGGYSSQWHDNDGKCGLCGNDFSDQIPRAHELGGLYGEGVVVKNYKPNSELDVAVLITANHRGYFLFDLCNLDDDQNESEECFEKIPLELKTGGFKYVLPNFSAAWFNTTIILPENILCNHCIFRWTYVTGNTWGTCEDNTSGLGCGPQENFRGCSDISIS